MSGRDGRAEVVGMFVLVVGRMTRRVPFLLPLGRRLSPVAQRSVTTLVNHAVLLLVKGILSIRSNAHVAVLYLPICLGILVVFKLLVTVEFLIRMPMPDALTFPLIQYVHYESVHHFISLILLVGFPDAKLIIDLALVNGRDSFVDSVVIRILRSAERGQKTNLDPVRNPGESAGRPIEWDRHVRLPIRQIVVRVHFDAEGVFARREAKGARKGSPTHQIAYRYTRPI